MKTQLLMSNSGFYFLKTTKNFFFDLLTREWGS